MCLLLRVWAGFRVAGGSRPGSVYAAAGTCVRVVPLGETASTNKGPDAIRKKWNTSYRTVQLVVAVRGAVRSVDSGNTLRAEACGLHRRYLWATPSLGAVLHGRTPDHQAGAVVPAVNPNIESEHFPLKCSILACDRPMQVARRWRC